ncbi:hypothetical protein Pdw03_6557 [Penicillium digitatum]|uniref:Uncharacterized protein n=1 Tax=Penicillium digitatum TaxID=36651 RepID=A0A7T6XK78_PENDI|nr:hypothetical protein Pdw03_6557 [Penicillium digitatum]
MASFRTAARLSKSLRPGPLRLNTTFSRFYSSEKSDCRCFRTRPQNHRHQSRRNNSIICYASRLFPSLPIRKKSSPCSIHSSLKFIL